MKTSELCPVIFIFNFENIRQINLCILNMFLLGVQDKIHKTYLVHIKQ